MSAGKGIPYIQGYEYEYPSPTGQINPYNTPKFEESAFFPITGDGRYMMTIRIMTADASCMVPLQCMNDVEMASDSGADMILITRQISDMLGYQVDMMSEDYNFIVQGINDSSVFKEVTTWIQIGNMRPLQVPIGLAVNADALVENLFGNKGTIGSGEVSVTYSSRGALYQEAMTSAASNVSII